MKSKTRPISKSSLGTADPVAQALAVGHRPTVSLTPQDETLFRAFQSNLLSLISHELRTPLTGILNALGVLEAGDSQALPPAEAIRMAKRNAERLQHSLSALLDLAAIETGTFHVRLREVDLYRLVRSKYEARRKSLEDLGLKGKWVEDLDGTLTRPVLADPQKLGQAVDLCFQILVARAEPTSSVQVRISSSALEFRFPISPAAQQVWQSSWSQSLVGLQGGMASPYSAFVGVLQSEEAFLTRSEEGLGSEFLLIHEILKLHGGQFTSSLTGNSACMRLELPQLTSEESLRAVLVSRAYPLSTELGTVALILVQLPHSAHVLQIRDKVSNSLVRSTDAVYPLPLSHQLALVMNDCKNEDAPRLIKRISKLLGRILGQESSKVTFGCAHCPQDSLDPGALLEIAEKRLTKIPEKE